MSDAKIDLSYFEITSLRRSVERSIELMASEPDATNRRTLRDFLDKLKAAHPTALRTYNARLAAEVRSAFKQ